jgi:tRNA (guanine-N7-)-methyltransferase
MKELITQELPKIQIKQVPGKLLSSALDLFPTYITEAWMEIGFGAGEHLAWQADNNPNIGFIGCEPFVNGVASLLRHASNKELSNIRILADDVRPFLSHLPDHSINRLFILFPDPWRKNRHKSRRIIQESTLNEFYRLLKPYSELRVATDDPIYLRWILSHFNNHKGFEWLARRPEHWRIRSDDWPETRYEKKALAAGRSPIFLKYRKI